MPCELKRFAADDWPVLFARCIQGVVEAALRERGKCGVMLTGGRSAERLYQAWTGLEAFGQLSGVDFYFGDERCVSPEDSESNYGLALRTLFAQGIPRGCRVFRMESDDPDRESAARRYGDLLPDNIDVLLLGVGEDGHIASLFPHSLALSETERRVLPISGPKRPFRRLTITPPVIQDAREVFVMAIGKNKRAVFEAALRDPADIEAIPARLVLDRTWIVDAE